MSNRTLRAYYSSEDFRFRGAKLITCGFGNPPLNIDLVYSSLDLCVADTRRLISRLLLMQGRQSGKLIKERAGATRYDSR